MVSERAKEQLSFGYSCALAQSLEHALHVWPLAECSPLATNDPLLLHMMWGMALFAKNVGVHYNVIGVLDLNYC